MAKTRRIDGKTWYYDTFAKTKGDAKRKAAGLRKRHTTFIGGVRIIPTNSGYEIFWRYK